MTKPVDKIDEQQSVGDYFVHHLSDVQTVSIGRSTKIWQYCVILNGAIIGANCNICSHVFIENDVIIGDCVTIKNGTRIYNGITLHDNVFVGPNVTFTNDKNPRSKVFPAEFARTLIKKGASIGGGSVITPGITIGENAMIGAGSVVTKDVPSNGVVHGDAAQLKRFL